MDTARWLANFDGNGASDEAFAEFFVTFYKMHKENKEAVPSSADMLEFNPDEFSSWIHEVLEEILFSEEIGPSCWWKN